MEEKAIVEPPIRTGGIIRQLGPGLIIAGSIVGSGELVATTKTGAEAGFTLLWLILIGCVIKVFVQIELGRYTLTEGKTTMEGLNEVPGPRLRVNWILWYWLVMFIVSLAQLGGVVGGVGQALAIFSPLTANGTAFNAYQDAQTRREVVVALIDRLEKLEPSEKVSSELRGLREEQETLDSQLTQDAPESNDDVWWAAIISLLTAVLLFVGRYRLIQSLSTALVATFTAVSVVNLVHLQSLEHWRISLSELLHGLRFALPATGGPQDSGLMTALAAFGIIGVGATELIQYPYWCIEKGYARWVGTREQTDRWAQRARGWMRVMHWDAWCSAAVYTFATVVFYLLGAAVLGRVGLNPEGSRMIRTLSEMYVPVFGSIAQLIFLFGAIAVLYSTFFVANAGHARVCADAMRVFGLSAGGSRELTFWTRAFSLFFPLLCLVVYVFIRAPVALILASGVMQAIMLPMLGAAALFFRYFRSDDRLRPLWIWDLFLWVSAAGLLLAGCWLAISKILPYLGVFS